MALGRGFAPAVLNCTTLGALAKCRWAVRLSRGEDVCTGLWCRGGGTTTCRASALGGVGVRCLTELGTWPVTLGRHALLELVGGCLVPRGLGGCQGDGCLGDGCLGECTNAGTERVLSNTGS